MEAAPFDKELSKYPRHPTGADVESSKTEVGTNFSRVSISAKHLYVYQVAICNLDAGTLDKVHEPLVRREVFDKAQQGNKGLKGKYVYFDGREYAYTQKSLHKHWASDRDELRVAVDHSASSGTEAGALSCRFEVVLRALRRYDVKEVQRYCDGDSAVPESYMQGFLYAVDDIVRSITRTQFQAVRGGRHLSDYEAIGTAWGFDIWWEYRLTMRAGQGGLLANISARAVPVISAGDVGELARLFFANKLARLAARGQGDGALEQRDWLCFEPVVRGLHVTDAGGAAVALAGLDMASTGAGEPCAVAAGGTRRLLRLAECRLDPSSRQVQAVLAPWQREDFNRTSAVGPAHRQRLLQHGIARAGGSSDLQRGFGITLGAALERVAASVAATPAITLQGGAAAAVGRGGEWEARGVAGAARLRAWAVVAFGGAHVLPLAEVQAFARALAKACSDVGMDVQQAAPRITHASAWNDMARVLRDAAGSEAQVVVCVLPSGAAALYGEIKRVALTVVGVHTQCVVAARVRGHAPRVLASVARKLNTKLGGYTAQVATRLDSSEPTMVLAADVNHTTEAGGMSVAAVVASVDAHARRFAGSVLQHPHRMELIENLDVAVRQALRLFFRGSGGLKPARIVYLRDGVSDSQMQAVKRLELAAIYAACRLVDPAYRPRVTLVLVRKRHHARFYPEGAEENGNCAPGTCVAHRVVSPAIFSFFLAAHRSPFGVTRPPYYLVLHDDCGFDLAAIRSLVFGLSFTYPILTRAVTMPAPLYYAHRLSGKGRLQLSQPFHRLPYFAWNRDAQQTAEQRPHLVPVHAALRDSMYFM
ncbi:hypothetical protein GGI04_003125 [Coemansia thaxteri]|nr:hypothetical protein GGI04_003125 [Coemansia thaxteri]